MQTALAVREVIFIVVDVLVGVAVYFISILLLAGSFDAYLLLPFGIWLLCYAAACWYFVPRLGAIGEAQADARSLMTGRVTDAYTNITTVKLFAHTRREAEYARSAMDDFKKTGYAQMRLVSLFELSNHTLITLLILSSASTALWLWTQGQVGAGVVAAVIAMALRITGYSPLGDVADDGLVRERGHHPGRHHHADQAAHHYRRPQRPAFARHARGELPLKT